MTDEDINLLEQAFFNTEKDSSIFSEKELKLFSELINNARSINSNNIVILNKEDYNYMEDRLHFLSCLDSAGVDNWHGYSFAQEIYRGESD